MKNKGKKSKTNTKQQMSEEDSAGRVKGAKDAIKKNNKRLGKKKSTAAMAVMNANEVAEDAQDNAGAATAVVENQPLVAEGSTAMVATSQEQVQESSEPAPRRPKRRREQQTNSNIVVHTQEGKVAGYSGKERAVQGYGCIHCSMHQLQTSNEIADKKYFEFFQKEGNLLHDSFCHGPCKKPGKDLCWKDRNKANEVVAYYCNRNVNERKEQKAEGKPVSPFCPWWCVPCFQIGLEEESKKYAEQNGHHPDLQQRRPTRGGRLVEKQPMVGTNENSNKRHKVGTSVESVEMSLPSSQS
jgi:hypothetical protein